VRRLFGGAGLLECELCGESSSCAAGMLQTEQLLFIFYFAGQGRSSVIRGTEMLL